MKHTWPQFVAKVVLNDVAGYRKKAGVSWEDLPAEHMGTVMWLCYDGQLTRKQMRTLLAEMVELRANV